MLWVQSGQAPFILWWLDFFDSRIGLSCVLLFNLSFASSLICDSLLTQQEPVWMFMNLLTSPQLEWNLCSIRLSEIWDAKTKWASSCSRTHCSPTCSPSVCTVSWTTVIRQKSVLLRQRSQQGESYEFTFVLFFFLRSFCERWELKLLKCEDVLFCDLGLGFILCAGVQWVFFLMLLREESNSEANFNLMILPFITCCW